VAYAGLQVLNGADFDVWPGQVVAITGENGAGKSTLVRCIAGDLAPDAGEVTIDGVRVRPKPGTGPSGLAVVWQDAAMCDNLDVAANLFLGSERSRWFVSDAKVTKAANALLGSYGITIAGTRSVGTLSSGQRQLISVVRAMRSAPRLLVLDEPTASVGAQERRRVDQLIAGSKLRGTTVVLVSHDMEQVFNLADRILVLYHGQVAADLAPSETHPDDVVAIMSGHAPDVTARHQLSRLQRLVDQLASAKPDTSPTLILTALASALSTEQLCIHLLEGGSLRLVAATGLPAELLGAWGVLPVGDAGGPMGHVAGTGRPVVDEDIAKSPRWARFLAMGTGAGIRSSWSVPLVGPSGLIGVTTGCQPSVGPPQRDQMDLVSLYAGYAAGAIERDRLFGEVTARNRVLETIREVLETLAGPEPVPSSLLKALQSLQRGLSAGEIELWVSPSGGPPRCTALVTSDGSAQHEPPGRDGAEAARALLAHLEPGAPRHIEPAGADHVIATAFDVPDGRAVLVARWAVQGPPDDAVALMGDAAHSVRLVLERVAAEQAIAQAAALRRSHQLQQDFLSRLSHELRTPLTAIQGYATSLLAPDVNWDDESELRFLERIASEAARMGRLVGHLLDFSAIESGLLRLEPDWCDLALIVGAAVSCLPPERARAVSVSCAEGIPAVWADHDRLEQVFVNLLDNAFRHNPPGVRVRVEVSEAGEGWVAVRTSDDGKGIAPEQKAYLFGPEARRVAGSPGTGLGLSIAQGIVVAHGGRIDLEDTRQGAGFLVLLPVEWQGAGVQ